MLTEFASLKQQNTCCWILAIQHLYLEESHTEKVFFCANVAKVFFFSTGFLNMLHLFWMRETGRGLQVVPHRPPPHSFHINAPLSPKSGISV